MTAEFDLALFSRFRLLDSLDIARQQKLVPHCRLVTCAAGSYLFRCADPADYMLFLLEGTVQFEDGSGLVLSTVRSGDSGSREALAAQSPRQQAARSVTRTCCLAVDTDGIEILSSGGRDRTIEVAELGAAGGDWIAGLLQMRVFRTMPPATLQAMFLRMNEIAVAPGQVIVRQGERGDYFYVVIEGRCVVTREAPGQPPLRLAELDVGACFGEEALIADDCRNATVMMLTRGRLMQLSKLEFRSLMRDPLSRRLDYAEAARRVAAGTARWLDVRLQNEARADPLQDAVNVPLYILRRKLGQLDPATRWITVCDDGRRSSVAMFVLGQKGYDAWQLDGGLSKPH